MTRKRISEELVLRLRFWSLAGDCQDLHVDPNGGSEVKCVLGSIGTAISIVSYYKTISNFFIEYTKDWKMSVIAYGANFLYSAYTGSRLGFGPFARTAVGTTPGSIKRD
ncbi:hypothetical protein G7Y89_g7623 [Cudoniella acicularis]|uniref:Uncharacterized protein n=1 Tax=Cudoniella acicularis TaxID=354080 RepID=A0A8H4W1D1_9HELO|nr:hypothetical protein G7Y89_g7623 [Cudoniella acicularis]